MHSRNGAAILIIFLMVFAPLSGCFGKGEEGPSSDDAEITPAVWVGGVFQGITISAESDLSAFVPYLIQNPDTGFIQNSTVIDIKAGESVLLSILAPPRTDTAIILIGDYGRENWPIREINESWRTWYERGAFELSNNPSIQRVVAENGSLDTIVSSNVSSNEAIALKIPINRPMKAAFTETLGGRHSTGFVNGLNVFNYISHISDETFDPTDLADNAVGYLDRWAGQGNAAYEDAALYLSLIHI